MIFIQLAIRGRIWLHLIMDGHVSDHIWPYVTISDHIHICNSPNKGFSLGRGSYLFSIELPLDSRICCRRLGYLGAEPSCH